MDGYGWERSLSLLLLKGEYSLDGSRTAKWNILSGVSAEWIYKWNILSGVSAAFITKWNILEYLEKEWAAAWSIGYYISRQFTAMWNISKDFGSKVKYSFKKNKVVTRFFRNWRNG